MSKTVIGGVIHRNTQPASQNASVEKIEFPKVASGATVPINAKGTLYLVNPPPTIGHYDKGDTLIYSDSNHNNDASFKVDSNVGPIKYKVTRIL